MAKIRYYEEHGRETRRVLASMVMNSSVCSRVASQWNEDLFDAEWANLVGRWCVDYVRQYGVAPNNQIRIIFDDWAEKKENSEEVVDQVRRFLKHCGDEYPGDLPPTDFLLDRADHLFNKIRLDKAINEADDVLAERGPEAARALITGVPRVELRSGSVIKPGEDWEAWQAAFDDSRDEPLIDYPGRLFTFLSQWLVRDSLIAFMGPDKTGKSVWLWDAAVRGVRATRRVACFDVGDMSEGQVLRRLGSRIKRHPIKPGSVRVPRKFDADEKLEFERIDFDEPLSDRQAFRQTVKICRGMDLLRVECFPNSSASVADLESRLRDWAREDGWVPDVVVIDYADILAPTIRSSDSLREIDETWKALRRLSQDWHCLVLTATQSSALAYSVKSKKLLSKQHFSGRKTKLAHVNGMVGLNVWPGDKQKGITRLNWVVRREGFYSESRAVAVAGCWGYYSPVIRVQELS